MKCNIPCRHVLPTSSVQMHPHLERLLPGVLWRQRICGMNSSRLRVISLQELPLARLRPVLPVGCTADGSPPPTLSAMLWGSDIWSCVSTSRQDGYNCMRFSLIVAELLPTTQPTSVFCNGP